MHFGIMAMQMDALIPPGLSPDNAQTYLATFDHARIVRNLAAPGFHLIELGRNLSLFFPQTFSPAAINILANLQERRRLTSTAHLPRQSVVEPSTPLEPVHRGSIRALVDVIHATYALQPKVCIHHATGTLAAKLSRMCLPATLQLLQYTRRVCPEALRNGQTPCPYGGSL